MPYVSDAAQTRRAASKLPRHAYRDFGQADSTPALVLLQRFHARLDESGFHPQGTPAGFQLVKDIEVLMRSYVLVSPGVRTRLTRLASPSRKQSRCTGTERYFSIR
jgi:hypothetical protein